MKKKLLLFSLTVVAFATISNAQTKVWDFGNDTTTWPLSAGIGSNEIVVDNLGLFPIATNTNFGAITANSYTFAADGFSSVNRFQLNGGGSAGASYLPVQRYIYFTATGACTVKIWFRTGGSGSRNMFITDGTDLIATAGSSTSGDGVILTGNVTATQAAAGKIYIYADQSCNLYKLEVTGATVNTTLSSDSFTSELNADVFTNNNQVSIANLSSDTKINVYNITGQLVKSTNSSTDLSFELNQGFYIINLESTEGKKTVKVVLN